MGFKNAFKKEKTKINSIQSTIDYFNDTILDDKYQYKYIEKSDRLILTNKDNQDIPIKFKVQFPTGLNSFLKENDIDNKELLLLLHNFFPKGYVPIELSKNNSITPDQLEKTALEKDSQIGQEDKKYFFKLPPLVKFLLNIEVDGNIYPFEMEQVVNNNSTSVKFRSINDDSIINIELLYRDEKNSLNDLITINYDFKKATSLDNLYKEIPKIQDLTNKEIRVNENSISNLFNNIQKENINKILEFYKKLYQVQNKIAERTSNNIRFNITKNITVQDINNLDRLYTSICLDQYYYTNHIYNTYPLRTNEEDISKIEENIDKELVILGFRDIELSIMEEKLLLIEQFIFKKAKYIVKKNSVPTLKILTDNRKYRKIIFKNEYNDNINSDINEELSLLNTAKLIN